jgi:heavy metal translocating P-type ATPase
VSGAFAYTIAHSVPGRVRFSVPGVRWLEPEAAAKLTGWLGAHPAVRHTRHNRACSALVVTYDPDKPDVLPELERRLRDFDPSKVESLPESSAGPSNSVLGEISELFGKWLGQVQPDEGWRLALASGALGLSLTSPTLLQAAAVGLAAYSSISSLNRATQAICEEHRLNVDVLDSLAIAISAAQGRTVTMAFMAWLIALGDWIRDRTAARSRRSLLGMLDYQRRRAWVLRGSDKILLPVKEIEPGDTVVVYAGEMVPVDGVVISGIASVDQSTITGEAMPVEKHPEDRLYAASVVYEGKLYLKAECRAQDALAAQIVKMVESSPVGETRMQNYAEKFADRLVAPTIALAGLSYLLTRNLDLMLSILIIDFGTGIRVAAPTTVLASISAAAGRGVLIRGGNRMERLARIDAVVFDKTGTLTRGTPEITGVLSYKEPTFSARQVLEVAAAAEMRFSHPVALATVAKARAEGLEVPVRSDSRYAIGLGVEAQVNGYVVHVGSSRFFQDQAINMKAALADCQRASDCGQSTLLVAVNGEIVGQLFYEEKLRPEAGAVMKALKSREVRELVMLTGDSCAAAEHAAAALGIDQVHAEILPRDKAEIVRQLQREGKVVAMVGDGINDAAALSYADVGIAMKNGTDLAQESAHIVLIQDDLRRVVTAIDIARNAVHLVHQNYTIVAGINVAALAMALTRRRVPPELTALLSNGSAVLASVNGLRPLMN